MKNNVQYPLSLYCMSTPTVSWLYGCLCTLSVVVRECCTYYIRYGLATYMYTIHITHCLGKYSTNRGRRRKHKGKRARRKYVGCRVFCYISFTGRVSCPLSGS